MFDVSYGMSRTLSGTSFTAARERITAALQKEGFGILTEIDVKATLKKKIDVDFRPYVILGACNPHLAHQALEAELGVGLLLPCNVVVSETDSGDAVVSILKPESMFALVGRPGMEPMVKEATARLTRALQNA